MVTFKIKHFLQGAFLSLLCFGKICAQDASAQQLLFFQVDPLNEIGTICTQGPAAVFRVCSSSLGRIEPLCSQGLTYGVATNEFNKKIVAYLDQEIMPGCCLTLLMAPPPCARSLGEQPLSTIPTDMVIEVSQTAGYGLEMVYRFSASLKAGIVPAQMRVVTLTLTDS